MPLPEAGFYVVVDILAASAANSSRQNAVPAIPQPPSAASLSKTQVRAPCVGSPAIFAMICAKQTDDALFPTSFKAAN
jgi:hypothetical protein